MSDKGIPDDETIVRLRHASPVDRAKLDDLAREDRDLAMKLADWDRQDAALRALYGPVSDEAVPQRFLDRLARPRFSLAPLRGLAASIALVGVGAAGGWFAAQRPASDPDAGSLVTEALRTHSTYVAETRHPVEVAASDAPHLTQWLSNRLGHRIALPDLSEYGFRLLGGRVVPNANGAAAMIMYEDDIGRRITLSVLRTPDLRESELNYVSGNALRGFWWIEGDLGCALVGDLPRDILEKLSKAAYRDLTHAA